MSPADKNVIQKCHYFAFFACFPPFLPLFAPGTQCADIEQARRGAGPFKKGESEMKQYEFEAINRRRGNVERIRATAQSEAIAREAIVNYYGEQFEIMESCCDINKPHQVLGEIDCSGVKA